MGTQHELTNSDRSYIPLMQIAMEYMELNNMDAAYEYFNRSLGKNNNDPYLYNELGVYYYKKGA